jgi:hypothetical protein
MRLMFLIALLFACLAAGAYSILRLTESAPSAHVEAEIGDARFSYQKAYARDAATAVGGLEDRLAFAVAFPNFSPLNPPNASMSPREPAERRQKTIFITVTLADDGINPADRPARLYSRFLEGEAVTAQGGLIMRQFESGSPYQLERLFLAPPDGRAFFARCPKQLSTDPALDLCLSIFRVKTLDVELRFASTLLEHWENLIDQTRNFIASIEIHSRKR